MTALTWKELGDKFHATDDRLHLSFKVTRVDIHTLYSGFWCNYGDGPTDGWSEWKEFEGWVRIAGQKLLSTDAKNISLLQTTGISDVDRWYLYLMSLHPTEWNLGDYGHPGQEWGTLYTVAAYSEQACADLQRYDPPPETHNWRDIGIAIGGTIIAGLVLHYGFRIG